MADDIRIKDLQSTASYMESDDYLGIDSLASGTRKINFAGLMDSEDGRLPTTDKTPRGAITEHEGDISEIKQSLSQKVNMVRLSANLNINYADASSIGYRTTETTKIDVTSLTGYPTGKTVLGCLAWGNDIYGSIIWVDNSNYLRGASKTSATIAVNIIVLYLD